MLNLDKIYEAQEALKNISIKTPILKERHLGKKSEIFLKCENLQVSGSFKIRGAANFINNLTEEEKKRGVIAWSAGNHAQGVALAAKLQDVDATICIPKGAPVTKIEETKRYGAKVILSDGLLESAKKEALEIQKKENSIVLPPYNHVDILTGQATIGLEVLEELEDLDAVVVPVGGGGLIGGIAYAIKKLKPTCKVYGVEAEGAASMKYSLENGKPMMVDTINTIADGIAVEKPGNLTYDLFKDYVDDIFTVSDYEISESVLHLLEKDHLISEAAGATAFAAIKFDKIPNHEKIACIISGGNIDTALLNRVVRKAMFEQKRVAQFNVVVDDSIGSLQELIRIISEKEGNIIDVHHDRLNESLEINQSIVQISFEINKKDNIKSIEKKIKDKGYLIK